MKREIAIGVTGSALVLLADIFAIQWSGDNNYVRAAVAGGAFVIAFCVTKLLPKKAIQDQKVLSGNEVGGAMLVDANEISANGAENVLSSNKTVGNFTVKVDKLNS